jgi:hypothetical protein
MFLLTFSGNETESIVNKSDNTTELVWYEFYTMQKVNIRTFGTKYHDGKQYI